MVGLDKPLARIWVSSLTCGSAKQAFCPNVRLKAWHGGAIDKPLARIWVSSLTCGSAKLAPMYKVEGLAGLDKPLARIWVSR